MISNTEKSFKSIDKKFEIDKSIINYALRDFFNIIIEKFLAEKIRFLNIELEIKELQMDLKSLKKFLI